MEKNIGRYTVNTDDKNNIPFLSAEWIFMREERNVKRLVVLLAITIVMLFASNALWLYAWMQYDYGGQEIVATQDGEGVNIVGGEDVDYGAESSNPQKVEKEEER